MGSSAMPHTGQAPDESRMISGSIGQVYRTVCPAATSGSGATVFDGPDGILLLDFHQTYRVNMSHE